MLPQEHGAWAILIAPVVVGLFAAPSVEPLSAFLFALGSLAAFLIRSPLQALLADRRNARAWRWLAVYGACVLAGFAPLLLLKGRWLLLAFSVPAIVLLAENLAANRSGRRFSAFNEGAGVLGLCLGAPAAVYAVSGALDSRAWTAWALSALYFCAPIFHVKMAALQHRASGDAKALPALRRMSLASAVFHAASLAAIAVWAWSGGVHPVAVIPFAAALSKTLARAAQEPARVNFRALGFAEVGYTALFTAAAAFALRP